MDASHVMDLYLMRTFPTRVCAALYPFFAALLRLNLILRVTKQTFSQTCLNMHVL